MGCLPVNKISKLPKIMAHYGTLLDCSVSSTKHADKLCKVTTKKNLKIDQNY